MTEVNSGPDQRVVSLEITAVETEEKKGQEWRRDDGARVELIR